MKGIFSLLFLVGVVGAFMLIFRGINNLMVSYDVSYFWDVVSVGFLIFIVASLLALKNGYKVKHMFNTAQVFNPVVVFAYVMGCVFGLPILATVLVEPQQLAAIQPVVLQAMFPLVSLVGLIVSWFGIFEKTEHGQKA